jgi:type I restriction enzyme S subunit
MFSAKVQAGRLLGRLNAEAYAPEHIRRDEVMRQSGLEMSVLGEQVTKPINNSIRDVSGHLGCSNGVVPMFRPADMREGWLDVDSAPRIPLAFESAHAKSRVYPGDMVLAIAGTVGEVAMVPASAKHGNINGSSARIVVPTERAGYVLCYLRCAYGQSALLRYSVGAVQRHLNLEDLPGVAVPVPSSAVCEYLGVKIRQAEVLRDRARKIEAAFRAEVGVVVPRGDARLRHSRVRPGLIGDDLNPGRFWPDRVVVRDALRACGARSISEFCEICSENVSDFAHSDPYVGLDGVLSASIDLVLQTAGEAGVVGTSRLLNSGVVISKLRPYLNKVAYVGPELGRVIGSTELLCVRGEGVHPAFVYGVLKLDTTVRQLDPVATGATHPRVSADDVREVLVPWHDEHERLGRSLEVAQSSYFAARRLTTAARFLVEALIERRATEGELVAAHRDPAVDRALLERLTTKGLDADGERLFPDLDVLAALLAGAA